MIRLKTLSVIIISLLFYGSLIPSIDCLAAGRTIKIGALFESNDGFLGDAFLQAIEKFNSQSKEISKGISLIGEVEYIQADKVFLSSKIACELLRKGVWAVVSTQNCGTGWYMSSLLAHHRIPYLRVYDRSVSESMKTESHHPSSFNTVSHPPSNSKDSTFSINFYPRSSLLHKAWKHLLELNGHWREVTIIYETQKDFLALSEIFQIDWLSERLSTTIRKVNPSSRSFRKLLQDCKRNHESRFIISLRVEKIMQLLSEAKELGLMTEYNNFIIVNMDMESQDWKEFKWIETNLTTYTLLSNWTRSSDPFSAKKFIETSSKNFKTKIQAALVQDAVAFFGVSLQKILAQHFIDDPPTSLCLHQNKFWSYGGQLINQLKNSTYSGLTGPLIFDHDGSRTDFQLTLLSLKGERFVETGLWTHRHGLIMKRTDIGNFSNVSQKLSKKVFKVNSLLRTPYLMLRNNHERYEGNEKFEGFIIDLLKSLQAQGGISSYVIVLGIDAFPGLPYSRGTWDDVIQNLVSQRVDMALGDLSITVNRQKLVDFTVPFMNYGLGLLLANPQSSSLDAFTFIRPFSMSLWCCIGLASIWVSGLMYFMGQMSPLERSIELPCKYIQGNPALKSCVKKNLLSTRNQDRFKFSNCAWFVLCSFFHQPISLNTRAFSTRTLAAFWWLFSLVMVSFYVANLAAFFISFKLQEPIKNLEAFLHQDKIAFGCVKYGQIYYYFRDSKNLEYRRLFNVMNDSKISFYVHDQMEGIRKVLNGSYAFFMETPSITYHVHRNCNLTQIEIIKSDQRGYGIALPRNSPHRKQISQAILRLQETHELQRLQRRWFEDRPAWERQSEQLNHHSRHNFMHSNVMRDESSPLERCPSQSKPSTSLDPDELNFDFIAGILIFLFSGSAIGSILALFELIWNAKSIDSDCGGKNFSTNVQFEPINRGQMDLSMENQDQSRFKNTATNDDDDPHASSSVHRETVI
ncbi:glutamate receptor ionotropic, kainate 3-like [Brevipalpus obovatus]|uniref:glutamate receptor ionotropic, kainate 3-like n=1 Tax=Brevipalpus obovatus TaxID=246614 RepID=UPI003D9E417B